MARPFLCGIVIALHVLGIGLAAWALVGIDRRGQQFARSGIAIVDCVMVVVVLVGMGTNLSIFSGSYS